MTHDVMAPFRVGRTGNAELDDALARIENMRQNLDCVRGALEDGHRAMLDPDAKLIDSALTRLANRILA